MGEKPSTFYFLVRFFPLSSSTPSIFFHLQLFFSTPVLPRVFFFFGGGGQRSGAHSASGELITCSVTENLAGGSSNESYRSSAAAPRGPSPGRPPPGSRQDRRKVSHGRLCQLRIKSLPKGARVTCLTSAGEVHPPVLPLKPLLQSII